MPSPRAASVSRHLTRIRRNWTAFRRRLRRWQGRACDARRRFGAAPRPLRVTALSLAAVLLFSATDLAYQVIRKPTELFFPVSGAFGKSPAATWRHYEAYFRDYSTARIAPELLAALAQVEAAGNPVARTYWRWQLSWNPFAIYQPASSAVGMFQMTDPAFAEARRHCIRDHRVVDDGAWGDWRGCWFNGLYTRVLPGHAIELAAIYLDRKVAAVLAGLTGAPPSPQQVQDLAALIHLCGTGPAGTYARRGFRLTPGQRCGDHDAATYLAGVNAMTRQFRRLAAAAGAQP